MAGWVPVIAAGLIRTPDQAQQALATRRSLVAVGQGLVMNPDWVELARDDKAANIDTALATFRGICAGDANETVCRRSTCSVCRWPADRRR